MPLKKITLTKALAESWGKFSQKTEEEQLGGLHLLLQLGLGEQLWDEVQTYMNGRDACHSQRQQSPRIALKDRKRRKY